MSYYVTTFQHVNSYARLSGLIVRIYKMDICQCKLHVLTIDEFH